MRTRSRLIVLGLGGFVELDVPHLTEEVADREAAIRQRARDVEEAQAMVEKAQAAAEVAQETIDLRKAEMLQARTVARRRLKLSM
jgi:multidrug resistance efflux pump